MIVWLRHGESTWNAAGRMQGRTEHPPLTERGREQVRAVVAELAAERPTRVLTSPAVRARESAEIVATELGLVVVEDDRLLELGLGEDPADVLERIGALAAEIGPDETVVAVSHGDTIALAHRLLTGQSLVAAVPNAGVLRTP
ncbi:MAG: histidine phosphatase family protein [Aeromicrobium erythreum]